MPKKVTVLDDRLLRLDAFGRVCLDRCPDEHSHIMAEKAPHEERRSCCFVVDEKAFPQTEGRKGRWTVTVEFEERQNDLDA